jgi:hypothetical protein
MAHWHNFLFWTLTAYIYIYIFFFTKAMFCKPALFSASGKEAFNLVGPLDLRSYSYCTEGYTPMPINTINCTETNRFSLIYKESPEILLYGIFTHHQQFCSPHTHYVPLCLQIWPGNVHRILELHCLTTYFFKNCKSFLKCVLYIWYNIMHFIQSITASCITSLFFYCVLCTFPMICGTLSPWHGASSGCGRRNSHQYGG